MKLLAIHTNTGSRFYRVIPQLNWMRAQGHEVRMERHDFEHLDQAVAWCDVVVLQMTFSPEMVVLAKSMGKRVIFECDDLIHKTHAKHYAFKETDTFWKRMHWLIRIFLLLRQCDGLIVSNDNLRRAYGWMAKRTLVFGNYLELGHWLKEQHHNQSDRVRILWAGSTSHTSDLEWVKPIIGKILEKYPQVQFIYLGHGGVPTDDLYARFIYGEDIFEGLPQERRESLLPMPPVVYPYSLATLCADIAIAPLEKTVDFNRYKTQCKYLEYAINGIPGVYSKWFYIDVKDTRYATPEDIDAAVLTDFAGPILSTGLRAETPEEWIAALSLLIEDATLRRQIGDNARAVAIKDFNFTDHASRWQGFVESVGNESTHSTKPSAPQVGN